MLRFFVLGSQGARSEGNSDGINILFYPNLLTLQLLNIVYFQWLQNIMIVENLVWQSVRYVSSTTGEFPDFARVGGFHMQGT